MTEITDLPQKTGAPNPTDKFPFRDGSDTTDSTQGTDKSVQYSDMMPVENAASYVAETSTGGDAIQAAIDNLPNRGGRVIIPSEGPDDNVTENGKTLSEDGVWKVTSPIVIDKPGVKIEGEATGSHAVQQNAVSGATLLVPNSAATIEQVLLFGHAIGSIENVRFDGGTGAHGGNVNHIVELRDNTPDGEELWSFLIDNCYILHGEKSNIKVNAQNGHFTNLKIRSCMLGDALDASIVVENIPSFAKIQVNNVAFSLNDGVWIKDSIGKFFMSDTSFSGNSNSDNNIGFRVMNNSSVKDLFINNIHCFRYNDALLKVESGSSISKGGGMTDVYVNSDGVQPYVVNNQGTINDVAFQNVQAPNIQTSKYNNVVNDVTNAPRCTINGLGYNGGGTPVASGPWSGNGREGIRVFWDNSGTPTLSEYINGTWYSRAL